MKTDQEIIDELSAKHGDRFIPALVKLTDEELFDACVEAIGAGYHSETYDVCKLKGKPEIYAEAYKTVASNY